VKIALSLALLTTAGGVFANETLLAVFRREVERDQRVTCAFDRTERQAERRRHVYACRDAQGTIKVELSGTDEPIPGDLLGQRRWVSLESRFLH